MKKYMLLSMGNGLRKIIEAANYGEAKFKAFQWTCDISGDRLSDVQVFEFKGELNLEEELNPHPGSSTYFTASLDYETGKSRTREKKKLVKEQEKAYYLMQLQRKIDAEDQFVVPYAEMTYKMKFISKEELDAIRERFEGEVK